MGDLWQKYRAKYVYKKIYNIYYIPFSFYYDDDNNGVECGAQK